MPPDSLQVAEPVPAQSSVTRMKPWASTALLLLAVAAAGCSSLRGTPARYQATDDIVAKIDLKAEEMAQLAVIADSGVRNHLQNKAMAVIDQRFHAFVRDLAADRADSSAAVSGTTLGASTAGAFVKSVKAKTNYALFAAGVVGAFGIVDKNYFYERTVPALVAAMRASRAKVQLRIKQAQSERIEQYSGVAALQDLEDYYSAGTLLSAISDVTVRAEADAKAALTDVRELQVPTDAEIDRRYLISEAIRSVNDATKLTQANAALKALGLPEQATAKDARAALVKALQPRTSERVTIVEKALADAGLVQK